MRRLFKFRYPKLLFLLLTIVLSYYIFSNEYISQFILEHQGFGYAGMFIAGMLFSFGFTTAFGVGYFVALNPESIILVAIVGSLGSLFGDLLIFRIIRASFMDEFQRFEKTSPMKYMIKEFDIFFHKRMRLYILYATIGIVLASPLPDEIGVMMLSGLTTIKENRLAVISYITHFIGILVLLLI